jgi:Mg-chelatase subunit ChlI
MSSPSDYSFMRTGVGALAPSSSSIDENVARKMVGIVMTMIAAATETAATYAEHAGRKFVHPDDVHRGLMYQAREFFKRENLEEEVAEMEQDIYETDASDSDDSDDDDSENDDAADVKSEPEETWTRSACQCETCSTANAHYDSWNEWIPSDDVERFIKRSVDKTIANSGSPVVSSEHGFH